MATITQIDTSQTPSIWQANINANQANLNADKAETSNVLELDNTDAFTPTADYHPATKKYVDDNSGGGSVTSFGVLSLAGTQTATTIADFNAVQAGTFAEFYAYLQTAPTGANFIIELKVNTVTQATCTITAGSNSGTTSTFGTATFAKGDRIQYVITQIGSTVAGAGLTIGTNLA